MSESRKIVINDSFLNSNGGNKSRKNTGDKIKKEKPKPVIKPNSLKKTLLEKIKKLNIWFRLEEIESYPILRLLLEV
jgi:hypothetical protein